MTTVPRRSGLAAYGLRTAPITTESIALIDEIEATGVAIQALIDKICDHIEEQYHAGTCTTHGSEAELNRLDKAEPHKWLAAGKQSMQTGLTQIVRAIVQPAGMC